jgi:hypothetical protein
LRHHRFGLGEQRFAEIILRLGQRCRGYQQQRPQA